VRRAALIVTLAWAASSCIAAQAAAATRWTGSFQLPVGKDPVAASVVLSPGRATVSLAPGHASRTIVHATTAAGRIRFVLPGLPPVAFDGRRSGNRISGTVRQGPLRGTFTLVRGQAPAIDALGLYRAADGSAVAIVQAAGLPTWLVELPSGNVHGLGASLTTVGPTLGSTSGAGSLLVTAERITWRRGTASTRYDRVALRQREVRVGAIAATVTLPPGRGPFPAVVMAHGSGPQGRDEFQVFAAVCELLGIAVIADDKRGIGQSQGRYPGEQATAATIDVLARDAQAEVRFLETLPGIDPRRIGIMGASQAGWVIALAAAREHAIRWAVPLVGPTVSVDEADTWGGLAGQGERPPAGPFPKLLDQVRSAGRGGFDPARSLAKLSIPVHWVFADDDRNVPTEICIERLKELRPGHDFTWSVIHATHTLFDVPSGLNADVVRSRGFGSGLFTSVAAWLRARHVVP
jgi:dienelactone hydrolase